MFSNFVAGEDSWKAFGQRDQTGQPKGNQPWMLIGKTDAETETPILWTSDAKSGLIEKDPDPGKICGQEEKRLTEDKTLDGITNSIDLNFSKVQKMVKDRDA